MITEQILEYINEKIQDAKSEIKEIKTEGNSNSYAHGYEAGSACALQELKDYIAELR